MPLATTQSPDLKPFRSYSEHDVINGLYSTVEGSLNKGTIVSISVASGNPNVNRTGTGLAAVNGFIGSLGNWGEAPAYATSLRFGVGYNKVTAANSGSIPLGMLVVDVREENKFGTNYAYEGSNLKKEQQVVLSGEGVKIVTKGLFTTNGFTGVPSANTGAYASGGILVPCAYNKTLFPNLVGKFLEGADADGFALFKLEL